ncbi:MAG: low molecular weight phosphotyrosine protein phosphatase [Clostridiales bacterium]|nr:low molecular weight phosphotyrosine protein phosphatase [Clostridiales bacterium]
MKARDKMAYAQYLAGLADQFQIESAATSREEIGNPPHYGTERKLMEEKIPLISHYAIQMARKDYDRYDYLIGMDRENIRNMNRISGGDPEKKIHRLADFTGEDRDIADPRYTGDFEATFRDAMAGCCGLLRYIFRKKGN